MDSLPSINLDELMKLDTALLGNDDLFAEDGIPCTFIEDLKGLDESVPLSPKGPIYLDPIIALPGMVPQTATAFHSEGSGSGSRSGAASDDQKDPTFHIEEEEEKEDSELAKKPKRKARARKAAASGPRKDPKERIRAKNRRAQARYREKQKAKRDETSDVLEQATSDLERLRLENKQLSSRNEIIENVLVVRDHSVDILEKSKEAEEKTKQPGSVSFSTYDTQTKIRFQRLLALDNIPRPGFEGAKFLSSSSSGTARGAPRHNPQKQQSTTATNAPTSNSDEIKEMSTGLGMYEDREEEEHCPLAGKNVAEMIAAKAVTHEEVKRRYAFYFEHLRDKLKDIENPQASSHAKKAAEESMMEVLFETGCLCFKSAIENPTIFQKLLVVSVVDDDNGNDVVKAAKWAEITRSLNLSNSQRQKMQPPREAFLQKAGKIAAERRKLLNSLTTATTTATAVGTHSAVGTTATAPGAKESLHSLQDVTTNWLALQEKSQALEANLMEEHLACMELVAKCFGGVLTPLQKAKAVVASYPDFPDVFAIATAAAVEHGAALTEISTLHVPTAAAAGNSQVLVQ